MKYILLLLLVFCYVKPIMANQSPASILSISNSHSHLRNPQVNKEKKRLKIDLKNPDHLAKIAFAAGLGGLLMIALPYLSFFGLLLGIGALILGLMMRKKAEKRLWAKLAITAGVICLLIFLITLGLVLFF